MKLGSTLVALAAVAGCATLPPCPKEGGPEWSEIRSEHFLVRTDLAAPDAVELTRELEEMRTVILAVGWSGAPTPPGLVHVVAVRSARELSAIVPPGAGGAWVKRPPFAPTLLIADISGPLGRGAIAHEITHDLAHRFLPIEPPWYSEGVATFFETLQYDRSKHEATIGMPPSVRFAALRRDGLDRSEKLLGTRTLTDDPRAVATFEDQSWLLFHYLVDHRAADLARLQDLLRQLTPWDRAFAEAFPDLPPKRLDAELAEYLRSLGFAVGTRTIQIDVGAIQTRALTDAEVHALRGYLFATVMRTQDRADREIDEALGQEPSNVEALADAFYFRGASADVKRAFADRAIAAHPASWLAAVSYADAVGPRGPGLKAALLRALPEAPAEPQLLYRLARLEGAEGRWEQALAFADRAIHLGESNDLELVAFYATTLAHVQRCGEASFVVNAIGGLVDARYQPRVTRLRAEAEQTCHGAPP